MNFYTKYKRPERIGEENDGISKVEKAGYVPAKQRVESLINAGMHLNTYREEQYDIKHGEEIDIDKVRIDPTRNGLDLAEASEMHREAVERMKYAENEALQRQTEEKGSEVSKDTSEPSEESSSNSEES